MVYLVGCFHFWGMLRASLTWHFAEIQPQEWFCFSCSSASLPLLKVGLDKQNNVSVVIPCFWEHLNHCGSSVTWFSVLEAHTLRGRVKEQLSLPMDAATISDSSLSLSYLICWCVSLPISPLDMMFNHRPDYFGDIINFMRCFLC